MARPVPETMTVAECVEGDVVVLEICGRMTSESRESELSGLVRQRVAVRPTPDSSDHCKGPSARHERPKRTGLR